jgi:YhcN/YlaJ family sporulation lipoprotein
MKVAKLIVNCIAILAILSGCNMNDQGRAVDPPGDMNNQHVGARRDAEHALGNTKMNNLNTNLANTNTNTNTRTNAGLRAPAEAQEKIESMPQVKHATVIVSNRNAFVAVVMENEFNGEVTTVVEDEIAENVWATTENVRNVYVSSNQDFFNLMREYEGIVRSGKVTQGLSAEFNQLTHRVFQDHLR